MPGEHFELNCASGGGFGDPLDRDVAALDADLEQERLDPELACDVYGAVFAADGEIDPPRPKPPRGHAGRSARPLPAGAYPGR